MLLITEDKTKFGDEATLLKTGFFLLLSTEVHRKGLVKKKSIGPSENTPMVSAGFVNLDFPRK